MEFSSICLTLSLFFLFLLLLKLFSHKRLNLPPSPPRLPFIGNLHQLGSSPHRSLATLSEKYGPLMLLKFGQTPTLVVSSADIAREVMKTHDVSFSNRHHSTAANIIAYGYKDMALAPYGEHWRRAKKICVIEFLSTKRVESFQYVRDEEVELLINRIRKACVDGDYVNLHQLLFSTSNNIVSICALGDKFEDENGKSTFGSLTRRAMVLVSTFCVGDFFPIFRWVDVLRGFIGEVKEVSKTFGDFLDNLIEEHKVKMGTDEQSDKKDFVNIMLQLQQGDMLDRHFSQDNMKAILQDLFIAGSDTTATGLEWTITELMRNPHAMKKVQEEVRRVIGNKAKIEMNDIRRMEYMNCVIKESLRLHPPLPLVPRRTLKTVNIEGYYVASGTNVLINVWAIQRDPKIWDKPNDFIPERFMNITVDFQGQTFEFIPFGSGRRKCPGISFGLASFAYVLANLVYWFDWELPDDSVMDVDEVNGLAVCKKSPLILKPIPYHI